MYFITSRVLKILSDLAKGNDSKEISERTISDKKDVVTVGDLKAGSFIIKSLLPSNGGLLVESEEYGRLGDAKGKYYVAIDDIDGSNNLRVGNGLLPYCSMIVVFENAYCRACTYQDYVCVACLEHTSGRIFYTEKGMGEVRAFGVNGERIERPKGSRDDSGLVRTLSTDIVSSTRGGITGYAVSNNKPMATLWFPNIAQKYAMVDSGCSVFEYAMVGCGVRDGYIASGKKQHEFPLLYAFCRETGREMVDFCGVDYGEKTYEFSGRDATVIAGNAEIVRDCLKLVGGENRGTD